MSGRWDEEDWSMQLAALGATETSMRDLAMGADEKVRQAKEAQLQTKLTDLTASACSCMDAFVLCWMH